MNLLARFWRLLSGERTQLASGNAAALAPVDPDPISLAARDESAAERSVLMRKAVLDREMAVAGYVISQVRDAASPESELETDAALLRHVLGKKTRDLMGERVGFVSIGCKLLFDGAIDGLAGARTIALIDPASSQALDSSHIDRILALKQAGVAVGLADGRAALEADALAGAISVAFFSVAEVLPPDLLQISRQLSKRHPALKLGIRGLETQEEFDACQRMNFVYFEGPFILRRGEWSQNRADPSTLRISSLLDGLRKGAELEEIAEQIRLDPLISYRILRVANSAALGASREITSIKDATLILGREPLYRWLVLLLCVSARPRPGQRALLEIALSRGRLMELMAEPEASPALRQDLFLTGLFSLLDVMMQVPMKSLLSQLALPPQVLEAIDARTGPCAGALQLLEAFERSDQALVTQSCASLGIDAGMFNRKLAEADAWARESARETLA